MPLKSGRLVRALEEAKDGERESEPPQLQDKEEAEKRPSSNTQDIVPRANKSEFKIL